MKKNYILMSFFFLAFMITQQGFSQSQFNNAPTHDNIEGLSIYPNPVTEGRTYINITTKRNFSKQIEIYNVLGKQIHSSIMSGKELNISALNTGVYILKITENNISETRKLVIK